MRRIRMALFPALLFSIASAVHGQAEADARLAAGVRLFGEEKFSVALEHFSRMLADPAAAVRRPDALYWSGLSHLALGKIDDARRVLDTFLREYPDHASASDALYQRARVSYLAARYEESIRLFAAFLERYPDHFFASSALYWTADSLFLLGRLTESEALFRTLAAEHPRSLKYEATAYKLALIRLRFRENELLTLLRWSHEESLRLIEEFQRREREQSLAVYQRRLEETAAQAEAESAATDQAQSASGISALDVGRDNRGPPNRNPEAQEAVGRESLLALKAEALDLLAFYVDRLARIVEKESRP